MCVKGIKPLPLLLVILILHPTQHDFTSVVTMCLIVGKHSQKVFRLWNKFFT